MKIFYGLFLIIIFIAANGCKSEDPVSPQDPIGTLKVKGKVFLNGQPVQGALVSIDNVLNWRSTSGSDGSFEIGGISNGNHIITVSKTLENSKVVLQSSSIITQEPENDIGVIELPSPISMNDINQGQVTTLSIPLSWEKSVNSDFVEYKIYRKDSPGLDEATGEVIFATSEISQTEFTDEDFRTGKNYYYRVYAYLENGKVAGSNIVNTSIPEVNIIQNSDFEQTTSGTLPDQWTQMLSGTPEFNYFNVVSDNVQNGNYSLKITYIDSLANPDPGFNPWGGLNQTISTDKLKAGVDYTISFWSRSEIGNMQVRILKNGDFEQPVVSYIIPNDQGWTEHKVNFRIDSETTYLELWINTRSGFASNGLVRGWIDNMKLIR